MATSCKLPKAVTDAAIPRKVRAVCELIGGQRYFFVRGDNGKAAGRIFTNNPGAFARYIKSSYRVQLGGGGENNFVAAKAMSDRLWSDVHVAGNALSSLSVKGKMGLTPDAVKKTPAWQSAKRAYDAAFARLQNFNTHFTKQFKRELAEERRARRGGA